MPSFVALMGTFLTIPTVISTIAFPPPTGPYNTTLQTVQLTDKNRIDPFSPTGQPRTLMISIFTPILPADCTPTLVPYLDPQTASFQDQKFSAYGLPPGLFGALELQVCSPKPQKPPPSSSSSRYGPKPPKQEDLIIFSPALGTTRLFYSLLAQQLASKGHLVVTIDHPYDVDIVAFPDNTTILGVDIPDADLPSALDTRVKDIAFVLTQLRQPSFARKYLARSAAWLACDGGGLDVSRVGVWGHSFGGAAATEALLGDARLVAGINLDGSFFGDVLKRGLKKPMLIFAHEGKNRSTDDTWEALWPKLSGWKRELMLEHAAHYTFSDLPAVARVFGIGGQVADLLGTIDGARAVDVVTTYVDKFFGLFLRKEKTDLFDGKSAQFPEVSFESS